MGAEEISVVCQGILDKKVDHRRFPIGPAWKRKYCVLNSEALRIYRSKTKFTSGCLALRTVPLCHINNVKRLYEENNTNYFSLTTEQGETLTFRCEGDAGWVAQIQIQLIYYKNRQDIIRYKQLNNSMAAAENAIQRFRVSPKNNETGQAMSRKMNKVSTRGYRTVVLPNHQNSGAGIGLTVIPLNDGRIVVNRVLDGGPAMQLGIIHPHDQIISANGHRVTSVQMLSEIVQNSSETVTLVVKPRLSKPSTIFDDPKSLLKQNHEHQPNESNMTSSAEAKLIFEKGCMKEHFRHKESPKHFKFSS